MVLCIITLFPDLVITLFLMADSTLLLGLCHCWYQLLLLDDRYMVHERYYHWAQTCLDSSDHKLA